MSRRKLLETEDGCLWIENAISDRLSGVFIHWDIYSWKVSKVKKYKRIWKDIVSILRERGIKNIYAIPPSEFEEKLIKMFGFEYTGLTFHGYKLMRML